MSIRIDGTNTTANPGITGGDADTGLQFGTDEISFVTGGTERAKFNASGKLDVKDNFLVVGASTDAFVQYNSTAGNWHAGTNANNAFAVYTGVYGTGIERFKIDSSGYITTPNGPAFLVNRASFFTSGPDTRVPYDSVRFNRGNHFDASAGQHRFNVPVSGVYYFFASCYRNPADTGSGFGSIRIFVNNTTYFSFTEWQPFSNNEHHYTMATLNLSAGDFVSVNASAFRVDSNSFFGGYLIG